MRKRLDRYEKLLRLETDDRLLQVVDGLIMQLLQRHENRSPAAKSEAQPAGAKRRQPPASS